VQLTLRIQEVAHGDGVTALLVDRRLPEHLLSLGFRSDAHILLTQMLDMSVDAGAGQLLGQRDLLQGQLVDACAHRAKQRRSCEDRTLHD
jgi:hypothetical protein